MNQTFSVPSCRSDVSRPGRPRKPRAVARWVLAAMASWSLVPLEGLADEARQSLRLESAEIQGIILREFERRDPEYLQERDTYAAKLAPLVERLIALQEKGEDMACSEQIYIENRWLLEQTANWPRLETRIDALERSMETMDQGFAREQSAQDGSWGPCYEEWFLKLDAAITALNDLADRSEFPSYPLSFLDNISDSDVLRRYLDDLLISDVVRTGIDRRDELGAVTGALSQLLFKEQLRRFVDEPAEGFSVDDEYIEAYRRFLDASQDLATGYWGAWYRVGTKLYKSADLSLTFHTISYSKGDVRLWPQIIDTTLAIKSFEYPYGWLKNGSYNHHNNYDVLKIFRYGWPHMTARQKAQARAELAAMLAWCLEPPMDPKAPFSVDATFYSSPGDYYYYGVSFFDEIGLWNPTERFWTSEDFPGALALCLSIKAQLLESRLDTPPARAALQKLERNCP